MSGTDDSLVVADWACAAAVATSQAQHDSEEVVVECVDARTRLQVMNLEQASLGTTDTVVCAEPLDEIRRQQRKVFRLIVHFQHNVFNGGSRRALLQVIGEIVACVNANFFSEEHWLIQRRHRHHGDQCEIHRKVIKDLDVFHDALAKGTELPAFELTHGLDALLLYYLVDDLFNPAGLASLARRAAHDSWRLK